MTTNGSTGQSRKAMGPSAMSVTGTMGATRKMRANGTMGVIGSMGTTCRTSMMRKNRWFSEVEKI